MNQNENKVDSKAVSQSSQGEALNVEIEDVGTSNVELEDTVARCAWCTGD